MNFLKFYLYFRFSFLSSLIIHKETENLTKNRIIEHNILDYIIFLDNPKDGIYFPFKKINTINSKTIVDIFNEIPENLICSRLVIYYNKDNCNLDLSDFNLVSDINLDNKKLNIVQVAEDVYQLLPLENQKEYIKIWNFYNSHFNLNHCINSNSLFKSRIISPSILSELFNIYIIGKSLNFDKTKFDIPLNVPTSINLPLSMPNSYFHFKNLKIFSNSMDSFSKSYRFYFVQRHMSFSNFCKKNVEDIESTHTQYIYLFNIYWHYLYSILLLFPVHPYYTSQLENLEIFYNFPVFNESKFPVKYLWYNKDVPLTLEWLKYYLKRTIISNNSDRDLLKYNIIIYYNGSFNKINWSDFNFVIEDEDDTIFDTIFCKLKIDNYSFFIYMRDIALENFLSFTFLNLSDSLKLIIPSDFDNIE